MTDDKVVTMMASGFSTAEPRRLPDKKLSRILDNHSLLEGIRHTNNSVHSPNAQVVHYDAYYSPLHTNI